MNLKKFFVKAAALTTVLALSVTLMAGCATQKEPETTAQKNELIMGTNAAFVPFEFVTSADKGLVGEFSGVDVAIAQKIAEKADATLKIEDMDFDGLVASVKTGKVDFVAAGMTATEERKKNVDFSDTYYAATQVMVVSADNEDIKSAENLKDGKKVGVVLGYTGDTVVTSDLKIAENNIIRANRGIDIMQDVVNGKLDAVVIDKTTGEQLANKTGLKVVEDAEAFENEEYAIAVQKGNTELLEIINSVLTEMKENNEIEELVAKYENE